MDQAQSSLRLPVQPPSTVRRTAPTGVVTEILLNPVGGPPYGSLPNDPPRFPNCARTETGRRLEG
jgi:hypothetical protein